MEPLLEQRRCRYIEEPALLDDFTFVKLKKKTTKKVTDATDGTSAAADADGRPPGMLIALPRLSPRLAGDVLGKFESQLNEIQSGNLKHSSLPSLLGSCLISRVTSAGSARTPASELR